MARRGFWDSFYQGWEQGDKIGERNRGLRQQAEFKKIAGEDQVDSSQYNPEDFTDDAEKASGTWSEADQAFKLPNGGLQAPTNTPTWDAATNSYQGAQGQSLKPKAQFTLGGQTQSERFTPDQVQDHRNNRYADVYAANGDMDKAMGVRASAQSMKLGKVQLEQAEMVAKEVKYEKDLRKIIGDRAMGKITDQEAINLAINISDKAGDPAQTFGYKDLGDGQYDVGMLKDNRFVGSETLNVDQILQKAYENATPTLRAQATKAKQEQEIADRNFNENQRQFSENVRLKEADDTRQQTQFDATLGFNKEDAVEKKRQFGLKFNLDQQEANSNAGLRIAQAGYYGRERGTNTGASKGVGYLTNSGQPVEYDKNIGYYTRGADGKPTPVTDLRTISGIGTARPEKENTKAQDAKMKFIVDNPDATDAQLEQIDIRLGLKPLSFGELGKNNTQATTKPVAKPLDWDKVDNIQRALGGISENRKRAELLQAANEEARRLGVYNQ